MDDDARRAARVRAWIAFGLAGILLVVNIALVFAWREERRDRFEDRIEFRERLRDEWRDDMPGRGRGPDGSEGRREGRGDGPGEHRLPDRGAPGGMGPGTTGPDQEGSA